MSVKTGNYTTLFPICKQGLLKKRGGSKGGWKTWKERWFVLDRGQVAYFVNEQAFTGRKTPLGVIKLDKYFSFRKTSSESKLFGASDDRLFELIFRNPVGSVGTKSETRMLVRAKTTENKKDWLNALQTADVKYLGKTATSVSMIAGNNPSGLFAELNLYPQSKPVLSELPKTYFDSRLDDPTYCRLIDKAVSDQPRGRSGLVDRPVEAKYDDRGVLLPAPSQGEAGCGLDEKHEDADLDNSTNPFEFQRDVQGMRSGGTPTLQVQRHPSARVTERPPPLSVVSQMSRVNSARPINRPAAENAESSRDRSDVVDLSDTDSTPPPPPPLELSSSASALGLRAPFVQSPTISSPQKTPLTPPLPPPSDELYRADSPLHTNACTYGDNVSTPARTPVGEPEPAYVRYDSYVQPTIAVIETQPQYLGTRANTTAAGDRFPNGTSTDSFYDTAADIDAEIAPSTVPEFDPPPPPFPETIHLQPLGIDHFSADVEGAPTNTRTYGQSAHTDIAQIAQHYRMQPSAPAPAPAPAALVRPMLGPLRSSGPLPPASSSSAPRRSPQRKPKTEIETSARSIAQLQPLPPMQSTASASAMFRDLPRSMSGVVLEPPPQSQPPALLPRQSSALLLHSRDRMQPSQAAACASDSYTHAQWGASASFSAAPHIAFSTNRGGDPDDPRLSVDSRDLLALRSRGASDSRPRSAMQDILGERAQKYFGMRPTTTASRPAPPPPQLQAAVPSNSNYWADAHDQTPVAVPFPEHAHYTYSSGNYSLREGESSPSAMLSSPGQPFSSPGVAHYPYASSSPLAVPPPPRSTFSEQSHVAGFGSYDHDDSHAYSGRDFAPPLADTEVDLELRETRRLAPSTSTDHEPGRDRYQPWSGAVPRPARYGYVPAAAGSSSENTIPQQRDRYAYGATAPSSPPAGKLKQLQLSNSNSRYRPVANAPAPQTTTVQSRYGIQSQLPPGRWPSSDEEEDNSEAARSTQLSRAYGGDADVDMDDDAARDQALRPRSTHSHSKLALADQLHRNQTNSRKTVGSSEQFRTFSQSRPSGLSAPNRASVLSPADISPPSSRSQARMQAKALKWSLHE